ncbi:hypothetical protein BKA24_000826 [Microbacterium marinum]|uniref:Uncharacterized protein n=1 Tax=Microbacterium marinum TaxID=421115 RepID=A0A7W7BNW2_9MICO|nr:hypothetical protein [Microbacterium marinum]MBB4666117.1 hypothetical protein [Microbacterium marinum]
MPSDAALSRPAGVVWARVEHGFHLASGAGDFLGYVDRQADGVFVAFDMRSQPVGRFGDLVSAMQVVSMGADAAARRSEAARA